MNDVVEIVGPQVRIELNIGVGPISKQMVADVNEACNRAEDLGARAMIVAVLAAPERGNDRAPKFEQVDLQLVSQWERALTRLENTPGLTLACVEDDCFGAMLELLLTIDYRLAKPSVQFGLAPAGQAIRPGMAVHRLSSQLGIAHARSMVLLGRRIDADTARHLGLIDEISEDHDAAIVSLVKSLDPCAAHDWSIRRRLLLESNSASHQEALGAHLAACDRYARRAAAA